MCVLVRERTTHSHPMKKLFDPITEWQERTRNTSHKPGNSIAIDLSAMKSQPSNESSRNTAVVRKVRKQVRFASQSVSYVPSMLSSSVPSSILWYNANDVKQWRAAAREHGRRIVGLNGGVCSLSMTPETRGLEQLGCLERQRRRLVVAQFIVKQAAQHPSTLVLAVMADRCSKYAVNLAIKEATRDFHEAYGANPSSSSSSLVATSSLIQEECNTRSDK